MPLVLAGATSGQATIQATDAATVTLTLPATTGTLVVTGGAQTIEFADGSAAAPSITNSGDTNTGMFFPAADTIAFSEGGVEAMRLDASGNVGIGTTSPASRLNVAGTFTITAAGMQMDNGQGITMKNAGGTYRQAVVVDGSSNLVLGGTVDGGILFNTSAGNERMRIDSDGRLCINKTSGDVTNTVLEINGKANAVCSAWRIGTNGFKVMQFNNASNSEAGQISISASSVSYGTSSDYRLKENIAPMTGALGVVQQLKPVTYNWKIDGSSSQGFIAHELQAVVPDCVQGEKDAVDAEGNPQYQGIDTSFLVATLTAAIQEQQALITQLQADVAALKGAA